MQHHLSVSELNDLQFTYENLTWTCPVEPETRVAQKWCNQTSLLRMLSGHTRSCQRLSEHTSALSEYWILKSVKQEIKCTRSLSYCTKLFDEQLCLDLLSDRLLGLNQDLHWDLSLNLTGFQILLFGRPSVQSHKAEWGLYWQWMEGRDNCIRMEKSWTKRCIYIPPLCTQSHCPLSLFKARG